MPTRVSPCVVFTYSQVAIEPPSNFASAVGEVRFVDHRDGSHLTVLRKRSGTTGGAISARLSRASAVRDRLTEVDWVSLLARPTVRAPDSKVSWRFCLTFPRSTPNDVGLLSADSVSGVRYATHSSSLSSMFTESTLCLPSPARTSPGIRESVWYIGTT